jgi:hypothetical protein
MFDEEVEKHRARTANKGQQPPQRPPPPRPQSTWASWVNTPTPAYAHAHAPEQPIPPRGNHATSSAYGSTRNSHPNSTWQNSTNPFVNSWDSPVSSNPFSSGSPYSNTFQSQNTPKYDCLECRDFRAVDEHAAKFPRHTFTTLADLSTDLTFHFSSKTDKARAIFVWLHHNIAYDTAAFFGGNVRRKSPEETIRTGLAVCQGYAELFAELGRLCGLEVIVVSGHGKGYGYQETTGSNVPRYNSNHAWNAVLLDYDSSGINRWHLIDPCWGAGHTDNSRQYIQKLSTQHFTTSPEIFRKRHFPTDPKYQFCSTQMRWEEYIMMKDGPFVFSSLHDYGLNEASIQPHFRVIPARPTQFVIAGKCPHAIKPENEQHILVLAIGKSTTPFRFDSSNNRWTCEAQTLSPGSEVYINVVTTFNGRDGKGLTMHEYLRNNGRVSQSFQCLCKWNVV